ncbi:hypothetical protein [Vibrio sp.]|uniref:hypothetical protein n=1 Tax=Vibrio sp. TaxID=678 RepID=UPI003D0A81FB
MSALAKLQTTYCFSIVYFDGQKMVRVELQATSRSEALELAKPLGISYRDVFSITP